MYVVGLNLSAVPEVTLEGHSICSLTIQRYKIGLGRIHYAQVTENTANGASTLALKPKWVESTEV